MGFIKISIDIDVPRETIINTIVKVNYDFSRNYRGLNNIFEIKSLYGKIIYISKYLFIKIKYIIDIIELDNQRSRVQITSYWNNALNVMTFGRLANKIKREISIILLQFLYLKYNYEKIK